MVIAHTGIMVEQSKLAPTLAFYETALAVIGYKKVISYLDGRVNGFSDGQSVDWWVSAAEGAPLASHHAFAAKDRAGVDAFYNAALEAGGKDNGGPGVRAHYGAGYYAAFVYDPQGNNIEVVYDGPA